MSGNILLKRDEIGDCRRCGKKPDGESFKGRFNSVCTHMHSQNGWWLRIDHKYDFYDNNKRLEDKVGELMCPDCEKEYSKDLDELMNLAL